MAKRKPLSDLVPTSWIDPLLTGPDGIGDPPWDCRHILQTPAQPGVGDSPVPSPDHSSRPATNGSQE